MRKRSLSTGPNVGKSSPRKNHIYFKVLNKPWKLIVLDNKRYVRKHGDDSVAITDVTDREIFLAPKGKNYETIAHELLHAYYVELCLHSATEINKDDCEEIFAEFLAKFGKEALALADALLVELENRKL